MGEDFVIQKVNTEQHRKLKGLVSFSENFNLAKNCNDLERLIDILSYINNAYSESSEDFPEWRFNGYKVRIKFLFHLATLNKVLRGIKTELSKIKYNEVYLDLPSAFVLLRAVLENFLMHDFLYSKKLSNEEKEFRYLVWKYSAVLDRIKRFKVKTSHGKGLVSKEKETKELLKQKISSHPCFIKLTAKKRDSILEKGSPRLGNQWKELIRLSNLNNLIEFESIYSLMSSYSHTEGLVALQLDVEKFKYNQNDSHANLICKWAMIIAAKMIESIKSDLNEARVKFESLPEADKELVLIMLEVSEYNLPDEDDKSPT